MKKFSFPLERVLAWRHTQTRLEEAGLDRLYGELHGLAEREEGLARTLADARNSLLTISSASGPEIGALEHFRAACTTQTSQIAVLRGELQKKVALQIGVVAERRRDSRLLERLRERKLEEWNRTAAREVEQMAEESHISRLARTLQVPNELE